MSTVLYGAISRKRVEAPADESTNKAAPGLKTYTDILAALLPSEALAAFHVVLTLAESGTSANEADIISQSDGHLVFYSFVGSALALYLIGRVRHLQNPKDFGGDVFRSAIPAFAMAIWILIERPDFVPVAAEWSSTARIIVAVLGPILLGAAAAALGVRAHKQKPFDADPNDTKQVTT